jgi:hypothetical protein
MWLSRFSMGSAYGTTPSRRARHPTQALLDLLSMWHGIFSTR